VSADGSVARAATAGPQPRFRVVRPGATTIAGMLIDPLVAVLTLMASASAFGVNFDRIYVILGLLVFSMTFPNDARTEEGANAYELCRAICVRWTLTASALWLLGWSSDTLALFDARVVAMWLVATPLLQFAARRMWPQVLARFLLASGGQRAVVIAGANETGRRLADRIRANPCLGLRVAGFFDDRKLSRLDGFEPSEVLGPLGQLAEFVKRNRVDVIYSALPVPPQPRVLALLDELRDTTASIYFVPDVLQLDLIQGRVDTVDGLPVIGVCESPCYGANAILKRASDIFLSSVVLVFLAPLLVAIGIGVKLSCGGSIVFKQRRYGLDGREIVVYKFRTMTCSDDGDVVRQAVRNDPRTTRFGAFLRTYSLDELPQFVNVLQGRMSVVGPRPHAVAHNEAYRKVIPGYMMRHKVRPGITGLAQVRGLRGETDTLEKMRARIECDLEYLRNWSLSMDLAIAFKTVALVLRRNNAW
jgi:putative colanic acid biosysnthesis UDP-glucose lipid carrier transferase